MTAIRVELQLADGSFTSGLLRAGQSMAEFERQLVRANPRLRQFAQNGQSVVTSMASAAQASRGFLASLRDVSIVAGTLSMGIGAIGRAANGWLGKIVEINAEMERLTYLMAGMSTKDDPMRDAAQNVAYLREQTKQVPFSLRAVSSAFVKLKATGIDPTAGALQALTDGVAAFGGSDQHLERIVLGISQMAGKSVIQMEEMRQQLGESMPGAMQIMARAMGVSVADLSKAISTGTVAASSALEKFYQEVNRTFGGSAQRMMRSFQGQVSQLQTNLQMLATNEGGTGFFDQIKNQLVDLNDFLSGNIAKQLSLDLGNALNAGVQVFRTIIESAWQFRSELVGIATIAATGIGLRMLDGLLNSLALTMTSSAVAMRGFAKSMMDAHSMWVLANSAGLTLSNTFVRLQYAGLAAATAMRAIITSAAAFAPVIIALGSAIYLLADHFGLLGSKTEKAYEELIKFGAASKKIAEQTVQDRIDELLSEEQSLMRQIEIHRNFLANPNLSEAGRRRHEENIRKFEEDLEALRKKIKDTRVEGDDAILAAQNREEEQAIQALDRKLKDRLFDIQRRYRQLTTDLSEEYDEERAKVEETGKSFTALQEQYQKNLADARAQLYEETRRIILDELKAEEEKMEQVGEAEKRHYELRIMHLQTRLADLRKQREAELGFGIDHLKAAGGQEKKVQAGQSILNTLEEEIEGIKAKMAGASGAATEMWARIQNGDFGSVEEGGEAVQELHDKLVKAAEAKEVLDRLMKGQSKAEADLEKLRLKLIEDEMELIERRMGRELSDEERFILRLKHGYYEGLGSIEKIREAIGGANVEFRNQEGAAAKVGRAIKEDAFGDAAVKAVENVDKAARNLVSTIHNLSGALDGVNFDQFATRAMNSLGGFTGSFLAPGAHAGGEAITRHAGSFLDLIGRAEGTDKGRGYNETLAYGRFTGGPRNLVAMTLDEIDALQTQMLRHPGNHFNSSAVGRYQIVQKTLRNLRKKLGLSGDMLFTPDLQDQLAIALMKGRGNDVAGLRNEWEGLRRVSPDVIREAYGRQMSGASIGPTISNAAPEQKPIGPVATPQSNALLQEHNDLLKDRLRVTEQLEKEAEKLLPKREELDQQAAEQERLEFLEELKTKIREASEGTEKLGSVHKMVIDKITKGGIGPNSSRDPDAPEYAEIIKAAKELDALNKKLAENEKLRKEDERDLKELQEDRLERERKLGEARQKVGDPLYEGQSRELTELIKKYDEAIERRKKLYGSNDHPEVKALIEERDAAIRQQRQIESAERQAALAAERRELQQSVMTQAQIREQAMQQDLARVDRWIEMARAAGEDEVTITQFAEEQKALIRQKYAQQADPLARQMKEWGDLQGNLAQASARWMESMADGLTDLIMGTGDLRQAIRGILRDIINMGIKYLMSQFMGGKGKASAAVSARAAVGKGGKMGGGKKLFPMAHTGGIIGQTALRGRMASPVSFIGAKKYHTGGIVNKGLLPSEVPIIAKKGEGVFTPEQMEAMGSFQQNQAFQINAPITVNGSAGTPEQNEDLAKKMAKQMEVTMRTVIADEVRKQQRPGNALNRRGR